MPERKILRCWIGLAIALIVLLPAVACQPPGALKRRSDNSVVVLPRSGILMDLVVYDMSLGKPSWRIVPEGQSPPGVAPTGELIYGVVPPGYKQVIPADGTPPPLESRGFYQCWLVVHEPNDGPRAYLGEYNWWGN
jgi:hypothetical protein